MKRGSGQNLGLREQPFANWGLPNDHPSDVAFGVREATHDALIWEVVFGAEATLRLNNVLSTQTSNAWGTAFALHPKAWGRG